VCRSAIEGLYLGDSVDLHRGGEEFRVNGHAPAIDFLSSRIFGYNYRDSQEVNTYLPGRKLLMKRMKEDQELIRARCWDANVPEG
jgi:hypothetical protein